MNYAVISGMQKIRLAGAEKRVFARWLRLYSREAALIYNPVTFLKISKVLVSAVSVLGSIVLYAVAIRSDFQLRLSAEKLESILTQELA